MANTKIVSMLENIEKFISEFAKSLHQETFVKMTLGNYKGADDHLQIAARGLCARACIHI